MIYPEDLGTETSPMLSMTEWTTAELDDSLSEPANYPDIASRFGLNSDQLRSYVKAGEELTGFGSGGSESLVLFLESPTYGSIVRKVCCENLSAVPWDPDGTGVMVPPSTKGNLQVEYLRSLPSAVRPYFPAVHDVRIESEPLFDGTGTRRKLIYDQSMLVGTEVSTFIAKNSPSPKVVAHLHHEVMRLLAEKVHPHRVTPNNGETIKESYLDKVRARLELSRQASPQTFGPLIDAEYIEINGATHRNIDDLLTFFDQPQIREMLEPQHHSLVMGDTNTENVMITKPEVLFEAIQASTKFSYDDIGLKFLDPRAIGYRTAGGNTVDDPMYDNKPVHNSLGNYDVLHSEHFSLLVEGDRILPKVTVSAHANNPYEAPYDGMEQYFAYIMEGWSVSTEEFKQRDPNWLLRFTFMMGSHFAAMPPFHFTKDAEGRVPEDPEAQKRAIAIYCEGIKWLTMARDMITGHRQDLYGVPTGELRASNR